MQGECHESLSLSLELKLLTCFQDRASSKWIMGGLVLAVFGGLAITLGLIWLFRDIVQSWARRVEETEALIY